MLLLCDKNIKEKLHRKKKKTVIYLRLKIKHLTAIPIVHLGSFQLSSGHLHSVRSYLSLLVKVITFQNEGGYAIWELGFFFFLMARSLNYFIVETGYHKNLYFLPTISCSLQHLVSFWGYFCAVLSPPHGSVHFSFINPSWKQINK